MRQLREILRLRFEAGLAQRAIASSCSIGLGTVYESLRRFARTGLSWPLPEGVDDAELESRLFGTAGRPSIPRSLPDLAWVHRELRRPGVTLQLLWHEYVEVHPDGLRYSQFCERYRRWSERLNPSMRQVHRAGEKTFTDYSGKKPSIVDRMTGEATPVELFVAVLGASSYVYAEASPSQDLASWIGSHVRMVEFFGGSSAIWVPDNLKSGITTACRYEPEVNRTYADLAEHYGAVVIPARPRRPKDKAKVEVSVQVVQRWVLAALRNRTFFSLAELNEAIWEKVAQINARLMKKLGASRKELFERLDLPALKPLPASRYELRQWKRCGINIDYHVEVDHNYYSVPHDLRHETVERVEACFNQTTVEIYFKNNRVASHVRLSGRGHHATRPEHMPAAHRAHAEWSPSRLISWGEKTGPATGRVVAEILRSYPHPEQGYRSCLGLLRLSKSYGLARVEAACVRAEGLGSPRYQTAKNILASGTDRLPFEEEAFVTPSLPFHDNVRGAGYYADKEIEC
jgi:transposase